MAEAVAPRMVKVRCGVAAGLVLVLHEKIDLGIEGHQFRSKQGVEPVRVQFGESDVDEEFIDAWLHQNAESVIVKEGFLKKWPPQQP